MIPKSARFKCPQCGHLKRRPGRCIHCGELPMGREMLTTEQVDHLRGIHRKKRAAHEKP